MTILRTMMSDAPLQPHNPVSRRLWYLIRKPFKVVRNFVFGPIMRRRSFEKSNSLAYLNREWDFKGWPRTRSAVKNDGDMMQFDMYCHLKRMLRVFHDEGHSGFSAGYAMSLFKQVAMFQPIGPLTGDESEWSEPFDYDGTRQNKRCGHVFLDPDGTARDNEGIIFRDPDGGTYISSESRVTVKFPYTPVRKYVDRKSGAA